jgi:hypothetical protein
MSVCVVAMAADTGDGHVLVSRLLQDTVCNEWREALQCMLGQYSEQDAVRQLVKFLLSNVSLIRYYGKAYYILRSMYLLHLRHVLAHCKQCKAVTL